MIKHNAQFAEKTTLTNIPDCTPIWHTKKVRTIGTLECSCKYDERVQSYLKIDVPERFRTGNQEGGLELLFEAIAQTATGLGIEDELPRLRRRRPRRRRIGGGDESIESAFRQLSRQSHRRRRPSQGGDRCGRHGSPVSVDGKFRAWRCRLGAGSCFFARFTGGEMWAGPFHPDPVIEIGLRDPQTESIFWISQ